MIKRIGKAAIAGIAALGLLATPAPAQDRQGGFVFAGQATTTAMNYPVLGAPRNGGTWTLAFTGVGAGTVGTGPGGGAFSASNAFQAGDVQDVSPAPFNAGAYCGMSGSSFTGTGQTVFGTTASYFRRVGWRQSAAGFIVFGSEASASANGPYDHSLVGWAVAVVDHAAGQSCFGNGATSWNVTGVAWIV